MLNRNFNFNGSFRFVTCLVLVLTALATCAIRANILRVPDSYTTVQAAINAAQPGDTVLVGAGVYTESISTARNGTAANPIVIDGQRQATVKQVSLKHPFIHLQNFTITGVTNSFSQLISIDRGASFSVISNNIIDAAYAPYIQGIRWNPPSMPPFDGTPAASSVLVISNTVEHVAGYVAVTVYGDSNTIERNILRDSPQSDCFNVWGRYNIFSGNICSNFPYSSTLNNHSDFIQTFGNGGYGSMHILVESNLVIGVPDGGVTQIALNQLSASLLSTITDWTFRNNVFVNIGLQGSCSVPNVKYYNNTFVRCNFYNGGHVVSFASRPFTGAGVYDGSSGTDYPNGGEVVNNTFIDCGDSRNISGWYSFGTDLTDIVADYNFVSKNGYQPVQTNTLHQAIGGPGGWSNFKWWEPHGINGGDPRFISITNLDLHLRSLSILRKRGFSVTGLSVDFEGNARPNPPSIGAFEYVQRPGDPSTPAGVKVLP